jgi:hypothetical protein
VQEEHWEVEEQVHAQKEMKEEQIHQKLCLYRGSGRISSERSSDKQVERGCNNNIPHHEVMHQEGHEVHEEGHEVHELQEVHEHEKHSRALRNPEHDDMNRIARQIAGAEF